MPTKTAPKAQFTVEQLAELFALVKKSDSIELKVTVAESDQLSTARALDMDPLDAQIRQVYFFDTPDLKLNKQGVVVRTRRIQQKGSDSVVKLRPVVPDELPKRLRNLPGFKVEVDATPGGYVCSGSLTEVVGTDVRTHLASDQPLRKLFSADQRSYYAEHAPAVDLDSLSALGPIFVLKLRFSPKEFSRKMVAELWMYPDNSRVLELSTKCLPGEGLELAQELRAFLMNKGVQLSDAQETKTSKALSYFSKQLRADGAG
jgi:hypothetical protein